MRLAVYLLTVALVYLAARSVTARTGHVGALLRWMSVVMLAFGAGEVAALTIVVLGVMEDLQGVPPSIAIHTRSDGHFWPSDALFAGAGMSLWIGLPLAGLHLAYRIRRERRPGDTSEARPRTVGDLPGRARHVATVGIIPAVCLAFLGGATRFVSPGTGHRLSLPNALADISLYPRLRPKPPPLTVDDWLAPKDGDRWMIYSGLRESWAVSSAVALFFLALLWLLLWKVVSGLELESGRGFRWKTGRGRGPSITR
ncbi:hypothetical protein [Actinomadura coerulea]|uniref:hypothetical protein n=1 Tax=Actinomadura coerulea TaxID=46159 RepID=UPI00341E0139